MFVMSIGESAARHRHFQFFINQIRSLKESLLPSKGDFKAYSTCIQVAYFFLGIIYPITSTGTMSKNDKHVSILKKVQGQGDRFNHA